MPKACGLTFEDLKPFIKRVDHQGGPINVLDLMGLRATKQTRRAKDIEDLRHIEAALAALRGEVDSQISSMAKRTLLQKRRRRAAGLNHASLPKTPNINVSWNCLTES